MRARGVAGLTRLPVTEEIAGSNPVGPAIEKASGLVSGAFSIDETCLVFRTGYRVAAGSVIKPAHRSLLRARV